MCCATAALAQTPEKSATAVPRLIKYSGALSDATSKPLSGIFGVRFALYADQEGGAPLWTENQNVEADANGQFTVLLGSTRNDGLPAEAFVTGQRWLGVQAQGEPERPRVLMTSVPYSLKAADAETLGGLPVSAFALATQPSHLPAAEVSGESARTAQPAAQPNALTGSGTANYITIWKSASKIGDSAIYQTAAGNVGIGTTAPTATLDAVTTSATGTGVLGQATSSSGTNYGVYGSAASSSGTGVYGANANGFAVYGTTASPTAGYAGVAGAATAAAGSAYGVYGVAAGTTGVGVVGSASSASGANFGVYGDTVSPSGIGVEGAATQGTGVVGSTAAAGGYGVYGINTATSGNAFGVYGSTASPVGSAVFANNLATTGNAYGVNAQTASTGGVAIRALSTATSGTTYGVYAATLSASGEAVAGVGGTGTGVVGNSTSGTAYGVYGANTSTTGAANGVYGSSASTAGTGVTGVAAATSGANIGIYGNTASASGVGISANATGGGTALVATATGSGTAAKFTGPVKITGNLTVTGTVSKGGGSFRIDDPIDPEHKYLYHSFVESPDMMNIYNGVVILSADGDAVVTLPAWFEPLNRDFRYQLTCIGGFAPVYIASEVSGNQFKIAGGKAGMKVSWQVTGIRKDAFANEHRIPVEIDKTAVE